MKRLDYIDSLRGIAIIMVIIVHTTLSVKVLNPNIGHILSYGQMGVQLFFIISSITLCMSYKNEMNLKNLNQRFYIKRYFRIAPLYYTGIIVYFLINLFLHYNTYGEWKTPYNIVDISANILFINDFFPSDFTRNQIVHGGWSIGTEMTFYVIFPFIYYLTKDSYRNILLILICSCFSVFLLDNYMNKWFLYQNIINMISVFIIGILYFKVLEDKNQQKLINNKTTALVLTLLSLIISVTSYLQYHHIYLTPLLAGLSSILLIELYKNFPKLNFKLIKKIGKLSYSIYLFHFIPAWYCSKFLQKYLLLLPSLISYIIMFLFVISTTYFIALISEKMIEKKGVKLGRKIIKKHYPTMYKRH